MNHPDLYRYIDTDWIEFDSYLVDEVVPDYKENEDKFDNMKRNFVSDRYPDIGFTPEDNQELSHKWVRN